MCGFLRRFADRLGYDNNFTIYDTDDQKSVMKDVCKHLQIDTKQMRERTILSAISSAKNELVGVQEYETQAMGDFRKQKVAAAYREYQNILKKNNAMDFDDLIMNAVELFKACPDVLEYYQKRFRYIMVDEYQDTNTAQFQLIRLLAEGSRKVVWSVTMISPFTNSVWSQYPNILDFEKYYPEAVVIRLSRITRSTQNVLMLRMRCPE